jgi:hypothetical protein
MGIAYPFGKDGTILTRIPINGKNIFSWEKINHPGIPDLFSVKKYWDYIK